MNLQTKQKGFTIVELLIVIVVIAILAAISIVAFTGIQQRGRDSQRASDASNIVKALTAYTADGNAWPATPTTAAELTTLRNTLNNYTTANLPSTVTAKINYSAPSSSNDVYRYTRCAGNNGATIAYHKESLSSGETNPITLKAGTGC